MSPEPEARDPCDSFYDFLFLGANFLLNVQLRGSHSITIMFETVSAMNLLAHCLAKPHSYAVNAPVGNFQVDRSSEIIYSDPSGLSHNEYYILYDSAQKANI